MKSFVISLFVFSASAASAKLLDFAGMSKGLSSKTKASHCIGLFIALAQTQQNPNQTGSLELRGEAIPTFIHQWRDFSNAFDEVLVEEPVLTAYQLYKRFTIGGVIFDLIGAHAFTGYLFAPFLSPGFKGAIEFIPFLFAENAIEWSYRKIKRRDFRTSKFQERVLKAMEGSGPVQFNLKRKVKLNGALINNLEADPSRAKTIQFSQELTWSFVDFWIRIRRKAGTRDYGLKDFKYELKYSFSRAASGEAELRIEWRVLE